ncbi:MAG: hypothetical protein HY260_15350 [Chloroflexi bacterium]|nr:hypothetical protein [Chloroflexota bacterium]
MSSDLLSLKRRWLPLLIVGIALFGAGLALFALWLYRSSPLVDFVVGLATTPARGIPPRGTLVSLTAAVFTILGGVALLVAVRRINASEIGEIDSFWWKVAVAALAGRWWLGESRVVVVAGGDACLPLLRGLKSFTGRATVLVPPETPRPMLAEMLVALAEDEAGVRHLIDALREPTLSAPFEAGGGGGFDAPALSAALRLRGRVEFASAAPRVADAIARADAIVFGPDAMCEALPDGVVEALRRARGKKVGVPPILGDGANAGGLSALAAKVGALDAALVNSNTVPPLAEGQRYLIAPAACDGVRTLFARDVIDWSVPARHDPAKLAVFLREVILRG